MEETVSQTSRNPAGRISVHVGDITRLAVGAIVNAANEQLLPGGGVCGAIHRAAGPELAAACREIGFCATGSAVITPGFRLPARFVIHAVGPVWAAEAGAADIAFPAISTGIFGYPPEAAARIALAAVLGFLEDHAQPDRVVLCCFEEPTATIYRRLLDR
jgi:O-acetyl-ADP-ribose deacetylase (regulator of RNase III)